ncbi:hypothetical protein C8T65DRAFT_38323 [Cerioporus squamosus]|nr:hypothetical protein C8T65DRAFT_38323 [Cerioporus squamosus]
MFPESYAFVPRLDKRKERRSMSLQFKVRRRSEFPPPPSPLGKGSITTIEENGKDQPSSLRTRDDYSISTKASSLRGHKRAGTELFPSREPARLEDLLTKVEKKTAEQVTKELEESPAVGDLHAGRPPRATTGLMFSYSALCNASRQPHPRRRALLYSYPLRPLPQPLPDILSRTRIPRIAMVYGSDRSYDRGDSAPRRFPSQSHPMQAHNRDTLPSLPRPYVRLQTWRTEQFMLLPVLCLGPRMYPDRLPELLCSSLLSLTYVTTLTLRRHSTRYCRCCIWQPATQHDTRLSSSTPATDGTYALQEKRSDIRKQLPEHTMVVNTRLS